MSELKNDRYLRALLRQPDDVTPVWMMRQAAADTFLNTRKHEHRRETSSHCAKNTELACEVTLQPLRRFPLDAAILFF